MKRIKDESRALTGISAQAKDLFRKSLPDILSLVNEKIQLQSRFEGKIHDTDAMSFIQD